MRGKLMRNVVLAIKEETTYGTDSTPTTAANSILARVSDAQPVEAEFAERNNIKPYLGSSGKVAVSYMSRITVEVELAGASAAGTVPGWGALLKACGMGETVVASTSVTYKPVSSSFKSVSIYYFLDGLRHKMLGCMGNASLNLNARGIPTITIQFTGLYSATTDTSLPTDSDYSAFLAPLAVNKVNTAAFTLHGVASTPFDQFSIDLGNSVVYRNMPNLEEVMITDRKASGSITIPQTSVATKAWHTAVKNGTLDSFSMTHGATAGNVFTISAPKVQLAGVQEVEKDGVAMYQFALDLQPNAGNDELSIAIT